MTIKRLVELTHSLTLRLVGLAGVARHAANGGLRNVARFEMKGEEVRVVSSELIGTKYARGSEDADKSPCSDDIPSLGVQLRADNEMVGRDKMIRNASHIRARRYAAWCWSRDVEGCKRREGNSGWCWRDGCKKNGSQSSKN